MSYHIYTTEGIILKRTPFGEANLLLYILTANLGLIMASARSARVSASKLRPALQEYTHATVSCVKGKGGWKVTNVAQIQNYYFESPEQTHKTLAQIVSLLIKMMPGESNHPEVFEIVSEAFVNIKTVEKESLEMFEILVVLRVLYELGYIAKDTDNGVFLENSHEWNKSILDTVKDRRVALVQMINNALRESQL